MMSTEDKEWGSFAEAAFLHGQGSLPSYLIKYSPEVHGTIFDTGINQQRWLAEFGVSARPSADSQDAAGASDIQRRRSEVFASAGTLYGSLDAQASGASGQVSAIAASQMKHQERQLKPQTCAHQIASGVAGQQEHQLHIQQAAALPMLTLQHCQESSMPATDTQQEQAKVLTQQDQRSIQMHPVQIMQQQQPVLGTTQQQLWGLQQQLWDLQQQATFIAQQQQQLGHTGQTFNVQPHWTSLMALPANMTTAYNVAGLPGTAAAAFAPSAAVPTAAAAAAASGSAATTNKRAVRSRCRGSNDAGAPASSVAAAPLPAHTHPLLGKVTNVVKKPRERQRSVVSGLEAELAEKLAQLQMLSAENEMLKLRAVVLEATVQSREDQMRVISEHGPPVYPIDAPSPPHCTAPSATAAATSGETGEPESPAAAAAAVGRTAVSGLQGSSSGGELLVGLQSRGSNAAGQLTRLSAAAAATAEAQQHQGTATAAAGASGAPEGGAAAYSEGCEQQAPPLVAELHDFLRDATATRETIKAMCVDDIRRHWKQFLKEVTGELVNVQREASLAALQQQQQPGSGDPGSCVSASMAAAQLANDVVASMLQQQQQPPAISPSHQRINELVTKYSFLIKTAQQLNPSAYCRLFGTHLDTGLPAPYSDAHWRRVVQVLDLSKHQVNHILACAELYFSCRAKLQNEQRILQQQLKRTSASSEGLLLASMADDSPMKPWLDQLANNLKREHVLRVMLNSFVWGKIFTPVQCAKAAVYSHPWYVDVHAIVCVMCEDALTTPAAQGQRPQVFAHRVQTNSTQQLAM